MRVYSYNTSALGSLLSPFVRHSNMLSKREKSNESPAEGRESERRQTDRTDRWEEKLKETLEDMTSKDKVGVGDI